MHKHLKRQRDSCFWEQEAVTAAEILQMSFLGELGNNTAGLLSTQTSLSHVAPNWISQRCARVRAKYPRRWLFGDDLLVFRYITNRLGSQRRSGESPERSPGAPRASANHWNFDTNKIFLDYNIFHVWSKYFYFRVSVHIVNSHAPYLKRQSQIFYESSLIFLINNFINILF